MMHVFNSHLALLDVLRFVHRCSQQQSKVGTVCSPDCHAKHGTALHAIALYNAWLDNRLSQIMAQTSVPEGLPAKKRLRRLAWESEEVVSSCHQASRSCLVFTAGAAACNLLR